MIKILYLFNGSRKEAEAKIKNGHHPSHGFWGLWQLPDYGLAANYVEIEQFWSEGVTQFFRQWVNVYFIHLPLFFKFFAYDIVFTSSAFGTQLFFTLWPGKKPLWVMHDFSIKSLIGNEKTWRQKIFSWLVSKSGGIVTLSQDEVVFVQQKFPHLKDKIKFIPFGVDLDFFKRAETKIENQILAVGFDPDRDWPTLIEAVKNLNIKVVLATRESRVAKFRPLPNNIVVKQFTSGELVKEYDKSFLVVLPLNTSYGNNDAMGCSTLFEAMAMGKTVIATSTKAMESYIKDGYNGYLVQEGDIKELHQKISELIKNPTQCRQVGERARSYAQEYLDVNVCTKELANFFNNLSTNNK